MMVTIPWLRDTCTPKSVPILAYICFCRCYRDNNDPMNFIIFPSKTSFFVNVSPVLATEPAYSQPTDPEQATAAGQQYRTGQGKAQSRKGAPERGRQCSGGPLGRAPGSGQRLGEKGASSAGAFLSSYGEWGFSFVPPWHQRYQYWYESYPSHTGSGAR